MTRSQLQGMGEHSQRNECVGSTGATRSKSVGAPKDDNSLEVDALFCPDVEVNQIRAELEWKKLELIIESGVAKSVAPEGMIPWIRPRESEGSRRGRTYLSASGEKLLDLGESRRPAAKQRQESASESSDLDDIDEV